MGAMTVCVVLLVTFAAVSAKSKSTILSRLLRIVNQEEEKSEEPRSIEKREIYLASASQDTIMFFLQTTNPKCRISCSEGATSMQRLRCRYAVTATNSNDPSETFRQTKDYWNPSDQRATFQQLRPGQIYRVEACRLSMTAGSTECDSVWCLTQGQSLTNDNCSSKQDDMNTIMGSSPFLRDLELDPEARRKAAINDLNRALQRLVDL